MTPSKNKVLITGGAGFIGTSLLSALPDNEWDKVVVDLLTEQVHPTREWTPPPEIEFIQGDICNRELVSNSLKGVNYIVHLAAETGVGQSAYEIARYVRTNEYGTAVILEEATNHLDSLKGIVLASSRAVYGEGRYECQDCGELYPKSRNIEDLMADRWNPLCPQCRTPLSAMPSIETQSLQPVSIYGVTKLNQEQLLQQFCLMTRIPGIALRIQNAYGPGQSLSNPYTGIMAIFSSRVRSGNPVYLYEDGGSLRDFIYISDVVRAFVQALQKETGELFATYNVGSGQATTIREVAQLLVKELESEVPLITSGKYRLGDIRHAWADIGNIARFLDFHPSVTVDNGLKNLARWVLSQPAPEDHYEQSESQLKKRRLLVETQTTDTS